MRTCISIENQISFIVRKNILTQNIIVVCSFDIQFMFVWAIWECSVIIHVFFFGLLTIVI